MGIRDDVECEAGTPPRNLRLLILEHRAYLLLGGRLELGLDPAQHHLGCQRFEPRPST